MSKSALDHACRWGKGSGLCVPPVRTKEGIRGHTITYSLRYTSYAQGRFGSQILWTYSELQLRFLELNCLITYVYEIFYFSLCK